MNRTDTTGCGRTTMTNMKRRTPHLTTTASLPSPSLRSRDNTSTIPMRKSSSMESLAIGGGGKLAIAMADPTHHEDAGLGRNNGNRANHEVVSMYDNVRPPSSRSSSPTTSSLSSSLSSESSVGSSSSCSSSSSLSTPPRLGVSAVSEPRSSSSSPTTTTTSSQLGGLRRGWFSTGDWSQHGISTTSSQPSLRRKRHGYVDPNNKTRAATSSNTTKPSQLQSSPPPRWKVLQLLLGSLALIVYCNNSSTWLWTWPSSLTLSSSSVIKGGTTTTSIPKSETGSNLRRTNGSYSLKSPPTGGPVVGGGTTGENIPSSAATTTTGIAPTTMTSSSLSTVSASSSPVLLIPNAFSPDDMVINQVHTVSPIDPSFQYWVATANGPFEHDMFKGAGSSSTQTTTALHIADLVEMDGFGMKDDNDSDHNVYILWTYPMAPPPTFWNDVRSMIVDAAVDAGTQSVTSVHEDGMAMIRTNNVTRSAMAMEGRDHGFNDGTTTIPIHVTIICSYQSCLDAAVYYESILLDEVVTTTTSHGRRGHDNNRRRNNNITTTTPQEGDIQVRNIPVTIEYRRINLPSLIQTAMITQGQPKRQEQLDSFQRFVEAQYWYKYGYGTEFPHHTQNVALLSLLNTCQRGPEDDKDEVGSVKGDCCVQVWRDDDDDQNSVRQRIEKVCHSDVVRKERFTQYRPAPFRDDSGMEKSGSAFLGVEAPPVYVSSFPEYVIGDIGPSNASQISTSATEQPHHPLDILALRQFRPLAMDDGVNKGMESENTLGCSFLGNDDVFASLDQNVEIWKDFTRRKGPIGARDVATFEGFRKRGIPTYRSSDFTQMLLRPGSAHDNTRNSSLIMMVDVDPSQVPSVVLHRAKLFTTIDDIRTNDDGSKLSRFTNAAHLVHLYATEAKVVITSSTRTALTASAMGAPVIFVHSADVNQTSADTMGDAMLFHQYGQKLSSTMLRNRQSNQSLPEWNFDLDQMDTNPGVHKQDRYRASFWNYIKTRGPSQNVDSAYLFGLVPLVRLGRNTPIYSAISPPNTDTESTTPEPVHDLFHFIYTTAPDTLTWRVQRAIEAVYFHHPNAKVIVHSNSLPPRGTRLDIFTEAGYDFVIQPYDLETLLTESSVVSEQDAQNFMAILLDRRREAPYWYSHETDLVRMLLMESHGGVYLDTDQHLVQSIPKSFVNVLGYQDREERLVNGAAMIFEPHNTFIQSCIQEAMKRLLYEYDELTWAIVGPDLLTYVWRTQYDPSPQVSRTRYNPLRQLSKLGNLFGLFTTSPTNAAPALDGAPNGGIVSEYDTDGKISPIHLVPYYVFYPYHWSEVDRCFENSRDADQDDVTSAFNFFRFFSKSKTTTTTTTPVNNPILANLTLTVHLNTKQTSHYKSTVTGSVCNEILHDYCLFCDEVYTQPEGLILPQQQSSPSS